jgi:hypothetical protein
LPGERLSGTFGGAQDAILWEAIRGPATDPDNDPDAPPFEIDIRITTPQGNPLVVEVGGHSFMDPSWADGPGVLVEPDQADRFFRVVAGFASALAVGEFPSGFEPEQRRLLDAATAAVEGLTSSSEDPGEALADEPTVETVTKALVVGSGAMSCNCQHEVRIRKKPAFVKNSIFDHSAIWLNVYSVVSGKKKLVGTFASCNHGTCASSSSMNTNCTKTFSKSTNEVTFLAYEACPTLYILWALIIPGALPVGHVCNDDTIVQYAAIKNSPSAPSILTCFVPDLYAPSCN